MCIKFKARCSLQCPSAALVLMSFWRYFSLPWLLIHSWPVSVPRSLDTFLKVLASLLVAFLRALLFLHHLCLYSRLHWSQANLTVRPLCWCGPVMWPVLPPVLLVHHNPLPVSNHVPSSKLKHKLISIFSSGLTVKSLWQSLLWLYFSLSMLWTMSIATTGAAEKWLQKNRTDMKNALLRSRNTLNRKLLCFPMWTK